MGALRYLLYLLIAVWNRRLKLESVDTSKYSTQIYDRYPKPSEATYLNE